MPRWRCFPPVHSALPAGALSSAFVSRSGQRAELALSNAQKALSARYPQHDLLLLQSGTAALQLALTATRGSLPNPCVALPAYACPDLGTAAIGAGFTVALYDVNPVTLQPDQQSLVAALQFGATHVVAAHLFGRLVDVPALMHAAQQFGAVVIEDAAQHAGGTLHGTRGGALAPISILSFGRGKGINAGAGGALLWNKEALGEFAPAIEPAAPALKHLLVASAANALSHPWLYALPNAIPALGLGQTQYHPPQPARSMHGSAAALLYAALEAEPEILQARRRVEQWYDHELATMPQLKCEILPGCVSGALRYPVRLTPAQGQPLTRLGVARSYPRTLAEYPQIRDVVTHSPATPGATHLAATLHTLPTHALLSDTDRQAIVRCITES